MIIKELGVSQESANVQPIVSRNGSDLVVDLGPFAAFVAAHGGVFTRVGIGGLDLGVAVPEPSVALVGVSALAGLVVVTLRRRPRP